MVSETRVLKRVTIPALPEQVRVVRAFVAGVLGQYHPHADVALLLASELMTNSVRHGGSAVPGGLVTVTVAACSKGVRIEVTERSGDGVPVLKPADGGGEAEGSRGLLLVDALAARWGYQRGGGLATTWFVRTHCCVFALVIDLACTSSGEDASACPLRRRSPALNAGQVHGRLIPGPSQVSGGHGGFMAAGRHAPRAGLSRPRSPATPRACTGAR
jgi:anti-sigma regulatory factor (Ser/Thr protein kinase)